MRPETRLQRDMRHYLALKGYRTVAVPNGATLSGSAKDRAVQMANLKRDGLTPGFPDLIVFGNGGRIGFIEVKCEGNYQTASQKECERWLTEMGQPVTVCRSLLDIDDTLESWGWNTQPVDKNNQTSPWSEISGAVEQKQAEQCPTTARPTPETLNRSATDAA